MKDFATYLGDIGEVGYIEEVRSSVAFISGLPKAKPNEVIITQTGQIGQVVNLKENRLEAILFGKTPVRTGTRVTRTNEPLAVAVGFELLGQTVDALGQPMDTAKVFPKPKDTRAVDMAPSGLQSRRLISRPCETGVTLVDLIVPLGKGQRELVMGDRKTGKSEFALQAILQQARLGTICVFACIGKNTLHIKRVEEYIAHYGIANRVVLTASTSSDSAGMIFLTPYTAMTIAEFFRDAGEDVLVVFDDLSTHAKFYREIGLLGGRFPGRNSYPSDIFYVHARLLERAGNFVHNGNSKGEASITCLGIVETALGDTTGYITTNLMSITDGHIYFDNDLFLRGRRPAINPFLSVTRLGRQIQSKVARDTNREIMSALSLLEKTQRFRHFGAELTEGTKLALTIGDYVVHLFQQDTEDAIPLNVQLASFAMMWNGLWRQKGIEAMKGDLKTFNRRYKSDEMLRGKVDSIVGGVNSLNDLLRVIATAEHLLE